MEDNPAKFPSEERDDVTILKVGDSRIVTDEQVRGFENALAVLQGGGRKRIVLDCTNLEHIASPAIGALLKLAREHYLCLFGVSTHLQVMFRVMQLTGTHFTVAENEETALASVRGATP